MVMTDLPVFSAPKVIATVHAGGSWKIAGPGTPGVDNHGDGAMVADSVAGLYRMPYRSGGTVNGCVYVEKSLDLNPYEGWSVPNGPADPTKAFPVTENPTNNVNVDTACLVVNPATGVITEINGVRPGALGMGETGWINTIQRRTSKAPHTNLHLPANWNTFGAEHLAEPNDPPATWQKPRGTPGGARSGGIDEPSIFYDPFEDEFVMFVEAKSIDEANPKWGTAFKNRIGKLTAPTASFDTTPTWSWEPALAADSWVLDPEEDPGYVESPNNDDAIWGTMPGFTQRCHVSVNPLDGSYHMVAIQQKPNTAAGVRNASTGIGHWYSLSQGAKGSWVQGSRNPLLDYSILGWDPELGVNRLNSPYLMWDVANGKVYLGFWGNATGEMNTVGTRFYLAEADLGAQSSGRFLPDILSLWDVSRPSGGPRLVVPSNPVPYLGLS